MCVDVRRYPQGSQWMFGLHQLGTHPLWMLGLHLKTVKVTTSSTTMLNNL
jgi:hypothetical protein